MRATWRTVLTIWALVAYGPAQALTANDTMAAWSGASAGEKSKIVTELLKSDGRESGAAAVVRCLDAASQVSGHADLPIGQVVKACAEEAGEPV